MKRKKNTTKIYRTKRTHNIHYRHHSRYMCIMVWTAIRCPFFSSAPLHNIKIIGTHKDKNAGYIFFCFYKCDCWLKRLHMTENAIKSMEKKFARAKLSINDNWRWPGIWCSIVDKFVEKWLKELSSPLKALKLWTKWNLQEKNSTHNENAHEEGRKKKKEKTHTAYTSRWHSTTSPVQVIEDFQININSCG